jgi:glycosyltransferase involved in cell wall biosynthesis
VTSQQLHPRVSVVIPAWGDYAGEHLDHAIESIRAQDLAARIVVVDNASEPALGPIAGAEIVRAPRRLTVGAARNLGLEAITTPYVVFWDADDVMLPGTLRFLLDEIERRPDAVAVAAAIVEGDPPLPHRWPRRWTYPLTRWRRAFALAHSVWSLFPSTGSTIMRTQAVVDAGGYADSSSGEDWVLGASLAVRGRVLLESRPGRLYSDHSGALRESLRSPTQLEANAREVRKRLRNDAAVPHWMALLLPLIGGAQIVAIRIAKPFFTRAREFPTRQRSVR